jgi:GMP synthase (glutamine-hydrolysing)
MSRDEFRGSKVVILDFGSQYTQVIARRVRESRVYSEILPFRVGPAQIRETDARGIILSGGPASVFSKDAPQIDPEIFGMGIPVLGICYGVQLMAYHLGGTVEFSDHREYGPGSLTVSGTSPLFDGLPCKLQVWNSHGDRITQLPLGFESVGTTENSAFAAIQHRGKLLFGLQFHPEVAHTPLGKDVIENFLYKACGCTPDWTMGSFIEQTCREIRRKVKDDKVVLGLSGGVDSSVAAAQIHRAFGDQLT